MRRRDLLRALGVTPLALPLLSACGSSATSGGGGVTGIGLVASDVKREAGDASAAPAAAASIGALAQSLYSELAKEPGNLAYSPYSIAVALAMTVNGARGETAEEMLAVLSVKDLDVFNSGLNALTQYLEGLAGEKEVFGKKVKVTLDSANSLWGQQDVVWQRRFLDVLARDYGTGMRTVDYVGATEDSRRKINAWTAEQTRDKINELIPQGVLDQMTRLVLVNAIYLKAPWLLPFEESLTKDDTFRGVEGDVTVPFMTTGSPDFSYRRGGDWQAARLVYAGSELAMTVVLPDDIEGFDPDLGQLVDWPVAPEGVAELYLPRWKVRTQAKLKDVLMTLGMPTAFGSGADLSGMTADEVLEIADVVHEAYVAVDEEGTEAAAATAVIARLTSAPANVVTLTLDRPFLYVIHDVEHGTPLFVGRVDDPSQES